jgi:hypothetical protein
MGAAIDESGVALLWDRAGTDSYETEASPAVLGWSFRGGNGWFIDEGDNVDTYIDRQVMTIDHACNTCEWRSAFANSSIDGKPHGIGNDNFGGLSRVLGEVSTH